MSIAPLLLVAGIFAFFCSVMFLSWLLSWVISDEMTAWYFVNMDKGMDIGAGLSSIALLIISMYIVTASYLSDGPVGVTAIEYNEAVPEMFLLGAVIIIQVVHTAFQFRIARLNIKRTVIIKEV